MEAKDILTLISGIVNFIGLIAMYIGHTDTEMSSICHSINIWAIDKSKDLPNNYKIDTDWNWKPRILKPSYNITVKIIYYYGDGQWEYYPFGKNVSFYHAFRAKKFKKRVINSDPKQLCIDAYNNYVETIFNGIT